MYLGWKITKDKKEKKIQQGLGWGWEELSVLRS